MTEDKATLRCENEWCKKLFTKKYNLEVHKTTCRQKVIHPCSHRGCGKSFSSSWKLERHKQTHDKSLHICERCSATYIRHDKFLLHKDVCTGGGDTDTDAEFVDEGLDDSSDYDIDDSDQPTFVDNSSDGHDSNFYFNESFSRFNLDQHAVLYDVNFERTGSSTRGTTSSPM